MAFDKKKFSDKVYTKACTNRITVREAADQVGVSAATFSRIQNGAIPDIQTFWKACKWLNAPMESFFTSK